MLLRGASSRLRQIRCEHFSRSSSSIPPSITTWIDRLTAQPPSVATDIIDAQRASHLQRTLPTRIGPNALGLPIVGAGQPLPAGHHLVYFQPQTTLDALGADGSSTEYNAPAPYLRRMWAGGSFEWNPTNPLLIGSSVRESTRVSDVQFKNDKIFIYQEKVLGMEGQVFENWAVKETRIHVFRTDEGVKPKVTSVPKGNPASPRITHPTRTFTYTPSSPLLFRYSALTFNGHKIHYDRDWTRQVEGHPDLVVHGPLTANLLIELAARVALERGQRLVRFDYRATSPMHIDREVVLTASKGENDGLELVAEQGGRVGMKATAVMA